MPEGLTIAQRKLSPDLYVAFLGLTASLGGMMFGFDLAIIVGAGPFLVKYFALADLSLGWAYSSLLFGCILGSLFAGILTDAYGRRRLLLYVAFLFILTSVGSGIAPTFSLFICARWIGGIAVGAVSVLSPMYVAEVSPPNVRGRMGAMYQMSITIGILSSYCINYYLRNTGTWNWRWMFISGVLPSTLFLATLLRAPETPRFLVAQGKRTEAFAILTRIMAPEAARTEILDMEHSLEDSNSPFIPSYKHTLRRVMVLSFVLAVLVHVSGIDTIIDYAPLMLAATGWKIDAALFSTFVLGGINCLFTIISFWTIDRYGRRPLYIVGSLGMTASLLLMTFGHLWQSAQGTIVLVSMALFIAFFASCIGPVFWTLLPEIFPNHRRGRSMMIPVITQWLTNAFVVLLFPLAFSRIGKAPTFLFLAAMAGLQAIFAWRYLPETKGRTLEDIQSNWNNSSGKKVNCRPRQ